jgi:hypothetical protein
MFGKILIFGLIAAAAFVIFGRGARRAENQIKRDTAKPPDPLDRAKDKVRAAKAEDLSPCPRCGAYVADTATCDCRAGDAG